MHRSRRVALVATFASLVLSACGTSGGGSATSTTSKPIPRTTTTTTLPDTYPLTGLPSTASAAQVPALEVKVDNAPGVAWPQAGLNQADVIYEEVVEGGITRYMAIFQSHEAPVVGPVRSVRYSDALIVAPIGGLFAYSGGIPPFVSAVRAAGIIDVGANVAGGDYYRNMSRPAPHNLFTSTINLRKFAGSQGSAPPKIFDFAPSSAVSTANASAHPTSISAVTVTMSGAEVAHWVWSASSGTFTRSTNGVPQVDTSGTPVTTNNIIVEEVPYPNTGYTDPANNPVPYANSIGTGTAYFYVDGKAFSGQWSKPTEHSITKYTTSSGQPLLLAPGRTWVMLAPIGASIVTTAS